MQTKIVLSEKNQDFIICVAYYFLIAYRMSMTYN